MDAIEGLVRLAVEECRRRRLGWAEYCEALGVPTAKREAVRSYGLLGGAVGVLPIQPQASRFDVVEGGQLAAILAAYWWLDALPVDLVAVRLDTPRRVFRYTGHASALGEPAIERARFDAAPSPRNSPVVLTIHDTPLEWLRSGCEGACVLDHARTPSILSDIDRYATTAAYAPKLYSALRQSPPNIGQVMVPEQESLVS